MTVQVIYATFAPRPYQVTITISVKIMEQSWLLQYRHQVNSVDVLEVPSDNRVINGLGLHVFTSFLLHYPDVIKPQRLNGPRGETTYQAGSS